MSTTTEFIAKAKDQSRRGRHAEAIVSAEAAIQADPDNAEGWWQLSLNLLLSGSTQAAISSLERTLTLAPDYAYGWARLGKALFEIGDEDRGEEALLRALKENANEDDALRALIVHYRKNNREADEYPLLDRLRRLVELPAYDQTRLGNFQLHNGRPLDAIECYTRGLRAKSNMADLFNLGLAFAHAEVLQYADAIDRWRLVKRRYPEENVQPQLDRNLPAILERAEKARQRKITLLGPEDYFQHYINPFELLRARDTGVIPDDKTLLRLRKALLQEIDLEGHVAWLENAAIDRSRAIWLCEELNDSRKRQYHWHVFQHRPLLRFLTRGEHEHFLVHETESPLDLLDILEQDGSFVEFLSQPFARQYSAVLMKALDQEDLLLLDCFTDGRRWVSLSDGDLCFEAARRKVDGMMDRLRATGKQAETAKPVLKDVEDILKANCLLAILNRLPTQFRDFQHEAAMIVRNMAIAANNKHSDTDLSKSLLDLCKLIQFRSALINQSLQEDFKKIAELIQEERKYEMGMTSGKSGWRITKEGATDGKVVIKAADVEAVRWGILVERGTFGNVLDFLIAIFSENQQIQVSWKAGKDLDKQQELFNQMVRAVMNYLLPTVLEKLDAKMARGDIVKIGDCVASKTGVQFSTQSWFRTKTHDLPWARVKAQLESGNIIISDKSAPGTRMVMDFRRTENAMALVLWADR